MLEAKSYVYITAKITLGLRAWCIIVNIVLLIVLIIATVIIVLVNLQASNLYALKNQNYGLWWHAQSDLLSLKEYSTNCVIFGV